jgi:hypothetical protein
VRLLRRQFRRQFERIQVAGDGRGNFRFRRDALDGARHIGRALHETRD